MENANIDQNDIKTLLAYNEEADTVERVRVDPITGAILIFNTANTGSASTTINVAHIDANDVRTRLGYNDTSGLPEALRCDSTGALLTIIV